MPRRNFFQLTSSPLNVLKKKFVFSKPINWTQIFNFGRKRPGRDAKKKVVIENSLRLNTCGIPAAAAQAV